MPAPTPLAVRQALLAAARQGASAAELADRFFLAPRTVRHLLRLAGTHGGDVPGPAPRPAAGPADPDLACRAVALRQEHPRWGAVLIRLALLRQQGGRPAPSARTVQRWLARAGLGPARPGRRAAAYERADQPHLRWQLDAADQVRLRDGALVSWLRAVDECSGAVLGTAVFPPRLEQGAGRRRAGGAAAVVRPLGAARLAAAGQRLPLGQLE